MFAKFSVKKPLTVFVSVFMIIILGCVSFTNMTPDLLPSINLPYTMIMTVYAGASPEEVEDEITKPMESQMAALEDIENITSTSSENVSIIILEFSDDANMDTVVSDIREKINGISGDWSEMVSTPYILEINPDLMPVTITAMNYEGLDSIELTNFLNDEILSELEGISGVASIDTTGSVTEKVEVIISQEKIDALNEKILLAINEQFDDILAEIEDGETELNSGIDELNEQESALEQAQTELEEGQDTLIDETTSAQTELLEQKFTLAETKADLETQLSEAEEGLASLQTVQTSLEETLEAYTYLTSEKANLELAIQSLTEVNSAYSQCISGKAYLEAEIEKLDEEIDGEMIAIYLAQIAEIDAQITVLEASFSVLGATASTAETVLAQYQYALDLVDENITLIEESLASSDIEADKLEETLTEIETQIVEVETGIELLSSAIEQVETGSTTISEAISELNKAQISGSIQISQAYAEIVTGQSAISSAQIELENAKTEIETAKEEIEATRESTLASSSVDITMDMINLLLTAQNFSMPAGYITEDDIQYLIRVGEEVESLEDLQALPLMYIDVEGLGTITLSDVADVFITDNSSEIYAKVDNEDGLILSFSKQSSYATATVSENIAEKLEELSEKYEGLSFISLTDQGDYIDLIVDNVLQSLIYGAILAVIILLLFLKDIRPTIIIACSIPISLLFAVVLMYFSGISLNIISLSGLAVGVGMLVDNSVVVIENIYRMRAEGVDKFRAAVKGATQVTGAIVASTLTTICVFLPIVFIDGITRELFTDMALTIGYSLGASLIIAITLVPAMASGMLKDQKPKKDIVFGKVLTAYEKASRFSLSHKWIALGLSVVLLISSTAICLSKGFIFMPSMSGTQITISVTPNDEDASFEDNVLLADEIYARIAEIEEIETVGVIVSDGDSTSTSIVSASVEGISMYAIMYDDASRKDSEVCTDIMELCADLDCEVSATGSMDMTSMLSSLSGSGVTIKIYGNDLDDLIEEAELISSELATVDGITEISTGLEDAEPEIEIIVDKEKAVEYNLTVAQVYQYIAAAITSETSSVSVSFDDDTREIVIYEDDANVIGLSELEDYVIEYTDTLGGTGEVKLTEIASINETESLDSISRENQRRVLTVTAEVSSDYNVTLVSSDVEKLLDDYQAIDGNSIVIGGESDTIMEAITQLLYMLLLAIVIIYFIMVAQFQSFKSPLIVMFTIPLAFTGGFLALLITGHELSVISMIGFVMLAGIIVNNGIVLIDYINILRLDGMEKREAIITAGKTRMRPILMTALTTILGLLFMALGTGVGTEMMQPIAIVCIGGLVYATLMTLFVVPTMYDILSRKEMRKLDLD